MKNTELIKALKEDAEWAHANEWETPITLGDHLNAAVNALEAADKREEELEEAQRWIPCSERLPEHEQNVLVYIPPEENYTATIDVSRGFMVRLPRTNVTHWQPLPQPPQKGQSR